MLAQPCCADSLMTVNTHSTQVQPTLPSAQSHAQQVLTITVHFLQLCWVACAVLCCVILSRRRREGSDYSACQIVPGMACDLQLQHEVHFISGGGTAALACSHCAKAIMRKCVSCRLCSAMITVGPYLAGRAVDSYMVVIWCGRGQQGCCWKYVSCSRHLCGPSG